MNTVNKGVYAIQNTANNIWYIGKTESSFTQRWQKHKFDLIEGVHANKRLQNDCYKYGLKVLKLYIVERIENKAMIAAREIFWINYFGKREILYNVKDTQSIKQYQKVLRAR